MFKYDVSVIVPVYNAEKYLNKCIESVLNQSYELKKIQLILINDGSQDNSLEICNQYAEKHDSILVINQENQGVSGARNAGIKAAEGKYIMLLDSDDSISANTVENLLHFFDEHYDEVDLVTYPMYSIKNNEETLHYRYRLYQNGEGVYNIDANPYIIQSTVNIIIKNDKYNILYNTEMKFSEDEDFNTRIIMKKGKIGFCVNAKYLYNKDNNNAATNTITNPLYCFDIMMKYYNNLMEEYKNENGKVPQYVQVLFINMLRWRISSDQLYPYYKNEQEFHDSINRIKDILKYVDVDTIIDMPNMDKYHKFFVINLKEPEITTRLNYNHFSVYANSILVEKAKRVAMRINKFKCKNGKVEILGYIRSIILLYKKFELFYVVVDEDGNKERKRIETFDSNFSRYKTKMEVTKVFGFNIEVDMSNVTELYFEIEIEGKNYKINYEFSRYIPFNNIFKSFMFDNKLISYSINQGKIIFNTLTTKNLIKTKLKNFLKLLKRKKVKAIIYRVLAKIYNKKIIWLYCDRDGVFDNAYYQFMYDIKHNDKIQRYYVYDDEYKKIKSNFFGVKRKKLVKYGSIKHKLLYIASSKVLTSFQAVSYYNPLGENMKYYIDILKYDLIYLQHGILHCHTPWIFSNEKNEIEKVVVSSQYEVDNFIKNYNYLDKNLVKSGMPRLDFIDLEKKGENKIVFAPTWRNHLIGDLDENNRRILKERKFLESNYYKKISELINSEKLIKVLEDRGFIFEFKIHPVFRDYINLFKVTSKNIVINADSINLDEYKLFITDYSSYVFDYVYLKRPILYFLPDEIEFNAGLHIYRKLDLPIEEGFGPINKTSEELVDSIVKLIDNDFVMEEKYSNIMQKFFISNENNHREKLYQELIGEK